MLLLFSVVFSCALSCTCVLRICKHDPPRLALLPAGMAYCNFNLKAKIKCMYVKCMYYREGYLLLVFQQRALRAEATVAKLKEEVNILKVIFMADCDPFYMHLKIQSRENIFIIY